jgi:ferredoxin-NADP reductase
MDIEIVQPATAGVRPAGDWNSETDEILVCMDVHQEIHDVKTFTFASPDGKPFAFRASQYFLFDLPFEDGTESRCYSVSSSPRR